MTSCFILSEVRVCEYEWGWVCYLKWTKNEQYSLNLANLIYLVEEQLASILSYFALAYAEK